MFDLDVYNVLELLFHLGGVSPDPASMFSLRTVFDGKVVGKDPFVFASEYAVTTGGGSGNLIVRHMPFNLHPFKCDMHANAV